MAEGWPRFWQQTLVFTLLLLFSPLLLLWFLVSLLLRPFRKPVRTPAQEVARVLREFLDGTGDDWEFDDFLDFRIFDPRLESIRQRVLALEDMHDRPAIEALIAEAEAIAGRDEPRQPG